MGPAARQKAGSIGEDLAKGKDRGELRGMPRIAFTRHLEAVGPCEPQHYAGATVRQLIEAAAADYPRLRGYVLDDQGRLRKHVAVFVDGAMAPREHALEFAVQESSDVYVFQALSGG